MDPWGNTKINCIQQVPGIEGGIPTVKCFEAIFQIILQISVYLASLALFVMLIVGGFRFLTAGGDEKATAGARQTMTYAIAGIALMAVAFLIFRLIEVFTGVQITVFSIPEF